MFCFFYSSAKGTNKYGMPFFAPTVMNQDNKHDVVLYGCCMTASGEAIKWILSSMCQMAPAFADINSTIFTDDGCPDSVVADQLPASTHLLCAWHIIDLDIYNCRKEWWCVYDFVMYTSQLVTCAILMCKHYPKLVLVCRYPGIDDLHSQLWVK